MDGTKNNAPLFLATDGSAVNKSMINVKISADICLVKPDIQENKNFEDFKWCDCPMIQLLSRLLLCPKICGKTLNDNDTGESASFNIAENFLPDHLSACYLVDSSNIQNRYVFLHDEHNNPPFRHVLHDVLSGVSIAQTNHLWRSTKS